jgi:Reverse transcriptase (RNA-dependent DNA polymerase)
LQSLQLRHRLPENFDSVSHEGLWRSLATMRIGDGMIRTVKSLCYMSGMAAKTCKGMSEWTKAILVSRQGDPMSPQLFVVILEKLMENMEV